MPSISGSYSTMASVKTSQRSYSKNGYQSGLPSPLLPLTAATLRSHSQQQQIIADCASASRSHNSLSASNYSHPSPAYAAAVASSSSSPGSSLRSSVRTSLRSSSLPRHLATGEQSVTDGGATLPDGPGSCASIVRPRPRSVSSGGGSGGRRGSREDDDDGNFDNGGGLSFRSIISSASFASLPRGAVSGAVKNAIPLVNGLNEANDPASVNLDGNSKKGGGSSSSSQNSINDYSSCGKGFGFVRDLYYLKQVKMELHR